MGLHFDKMFSSHLTQDVRVADDDEERLGPGDGHVEPLGVREEAESVLQVEIDELLLDGYILVVDNVGKQPEGFPAEVGVVGGEESRQDGGKVWVADQRETHSHRVRSSGEVSEDPHHRS